MNYIYRWVVGLALVGSVGGCFSPKFDDGTITCGPNGECPPDLKCGADLLCHSANGPIKIDAKLADAPPDVNTNQPDPPTLTLVTTSPSSNNSPTIQGATTAGTTVDIFLESCTGTPLLPGVSMAGLAAGVILPAVPSDTTSMIRGQAKNAGGTRSVCSSAVAYVEDSTKPAPPTLADTLPSSPSRSLMPIVRGTTEPGATVTVFSDAACAAMVGAPMVADGTGAFAIQASVTLGSSSTFFGTARDAALNTSDCSGMALAYHQDSTAVASPTITSSTPGSPNNSSTTPMLIGTTEANVTVKLYTDASCSGTAVATGLSDGTGAFSIGVTVGANSTTTYYGQAQDTVAGTLSICSQSGFTYTNDTILPGAPTVTGSTPGSPGNSMTPTISGSGEALATISLYTTSDCSGTAVATGSASSLGTFALPTTIVGTTTFYARATDLAGNVGACSGAGYAYTFDNTPPNTPTISLTIPASPSTSNHTPLVTGFADDTTTVSLFRSSDCSGAVAITTIAASGQFGVAVTLPTNATTQITATSTDAAGNVSPCSAPFTFVHDSIAPDAPIIIGATPGSPANVANPTINGASEANVMIALYTNATCTTALGTPMPTTIGGTFAIPVTVTANASTTIYAKATDAASNVSPCSAPFTYIEDATAPSAPTLTQLAPSKTTTTPDIAGVSEASATIALYAMAGCAGTMVASGTASAAGGFTIPVTVAANSSTTFSATATDAAGNISACSSGMTYVHDNVIPGAPSALATTPVSPAGSNNPSVSGTAETGATVRIFTGPTCGTAVAGTTIAVAGNTFAVAISVASGSTTTFYATATDPAGNISPCSAAFVTYSQDNSPPAAPTALATTPVSPAASTMPAVSGTAETGATVKLFTNSACSGGAVAMGLAAASAFSITATVAANSTTTFYATATDAAGNISPCSTANVVYVQDATAPSAPVITATNPVSPANANTPTVSGTAEANSTVKIYTASNCTGTLAGSTVASAGGTFSAGVTVGDNTSTTFYANSTDAATNTSTCSAGVIYVEDSTAPATPSMLDTSPASPAAGTSPNITGKSEIGATVSIYTSAVCSGAPVGTGVVGGAMTFSIPVSVAANTTTTFYARAADAAGNLSSCSSSVAYQEDSTPPTLPILTSTSPGSPSPSTTPTVNGTTEANATVKIYAGACVSLLASGSANGAGAFAIVTPVSAGTTTLRAIATDAAGNSSACSATSLTYTNDATPPSAPTMLVATPTTSSSNNPTISGVAEASSTVKLYTNNTCTSAVAGTTTATAGATFAIAIAVASDAVTTFWATATDAAGNTSVCSSSNAVYTEDSTNPVAPSGLATTPTSPAASNSPAIKGVAEAGSTVKIYSDNCVTLVASGTAALFGGAGIALTVSNDSTTVFKATATDAAGNTSACSSGVTYVEDSTPPSAPVLTASTPISPSNNNNPSISGTAEAASTVKLYATANCTGGIVGTVTATGGGTFSTAVTAVGANTTTIYSATATDAAGNTGACSATPLTYVEDSTPPAAPTGLATSPASPANSTTPTLTGTAEAGATIDIFTVPACTTVVASTVATAGGTFSRIVTAGLNTTTTYYVRATDTAGNASLCTDAQLAYVEDSTSVGVPVLLSTSPASPTNASTMPTVTGTGPLATTIKLYTNPSCTVGPVATLAVDGAGNFTTPAIAVSANATTTFYATATNVSSSVSACSAGLAFTNDTVAPSAPTGLTVTPTSPANNNLPIVGGTAESGATVKLYNDSACSSVVFGTGASSGTFSVQVTGTINDNTTTTLYANATDAAGNKSACSVTGVQYIEDSAAPAQPTLTTTTPASPSGSSTSPTINGTAEGLATVKVYTTSDCSGAIAGSAAAAAGGAYSVAVTVAANSSTTFHATATDAAGNTSACSAGSITYVHDSNAPVAPTGLSIAPVGPANNNAPVVSGTSETGATVRLYTNSACSSTVAGTGTIVAGTTFGITVNGGVVLDNTTTTFWARATDAAGNVGACSTTSVSYVEDSSPPTAPTFTGTTPTSPSKSSTTPTINGNAEAGSTVKLYTAASCASGFVASGVATGGGTFAIGVTVTANTTTAYFAAATDAAGNVGACSATSQSYTHDSVVPVTPNTLALVPTSPANNNSPTLTGHAELNATVKIYTDAACSILSTTGTAGAGGTFSIAVSVADNTSTTFYVTATDAATNVSGCSAGITYIEDSAAPAAPTITTSTPVSPSNSSTTPAINGTAEANATIDLYAASDCSGAKIGTGSANGAGNFAVTGTAQANVTTPFYATATDASGNTSACSTTSIQYVHDSIAPNTPTGVFTTPFSPATTTTPTLSGNAEASSTVKVYFTSDCTGAVKASTTATAGGTFGVGLTVTANTSTPITVRATDAAGNTSACSPSINYLADTIAPQTPFITSSNPPSNSNVNNPLLIGTAEANATVSLYPTNNCTGTPTTGFATGSGGFSIGVTVTANSTTVFTAKATDPAGNTSGCSGTYTYVEDSTPPATPTLTSSTPTSPGADHKPFIRGGTSEVGATINFYTTSNCTGTIVGNGASGAGGLFNVQVSLATDATTTLYATATDPAGNPSGCSSGFTYIDDETAPAAPSGIATNPTSPGNSTMVTISGSAESNATVTLYSDVSCTTLLTTATAVGGSFNVTITVTANQNNKMSATATDLAGNVSACSTPFNYVEDEIAFPPQLTSTTPTSPSSTSTTPSINGTGEIGATVTLYTSSTCTGAPAGVGPVNGAGSWSISVTVGANTSTTYYAHQLDTAGNTSSCSPSGLTYIMDSAPPTFAGAIGAVAIDTQTIHVNWASGSDNLTSVGNLKYQVCWSLTLGGCNTFTIGATTAAAATFYNIPGLVASKRYFIQVRAIDQSGNVSSTGTEVSERTWGPGAVVQVSAGYQSTCALISDGTVKCWGSGTDGTLGNGSTSSSQVPVLVTGLTDVVQVVVGSSTNRNHACALKTNGQVWCWGDGFYGELGNGSTASSSVPVQVSGITNAVSIGLGGVHSCAVLADGTARCWGLGAQGELGNNVAGNSSTPVQVVVATTFVALTNVVEIAGGEYHTCARLGDGTVKCWGQGIEGEIGPLSASSASAVAVMLSAPDVAKKLEVGQTHSCVITQTGAVRCWGKGLVGQLGNGAFANSSAVVHAYTSGTLDVTKAISVSLGGDTTCVALATGAVNCWGAGTNGQLGNGGTANSAFAVTTSTTLAASVTVGNTHACALAGNGQIACWGFNNLGQLGNGNTTQSPTPVGASTLAGPEGNSQVAGGHDSTCTRLTFGQVACWGENSSGQVGDNTFANRGYPNTHVLIASLASLSDVKEIAVGGFHACGLRADGSVNCWGKNSLGQLGDNTTTNRPTTIVVSGLTSVSQIAAGDNHTCALISDGTIKCWGQGTSGQLGNGVFANSPVPVPVTGITTAVRITAEGNASCAILATGTASCWGANGTGGLGNGAMASLSMPAAVLVVTNAVDLVGLSQGACALSSNGTIRCWGYGLTGQNGNNLGTSTSTPVTVLGSNYSHVAAGDYHACATTAVGAVYCWGYNGTGDFGNGLSANSNSPIVSSFANLQSLGLGAYHTCGVFGDGTVLQCTGEGDSGGLGDNNVGSHTVLSPLDVLYAP